MKTNLSGFCRESPLRDEATRRQDRKIQAMKPNEGSQERPWCVWRAWLPE